MDAAALLLAAGVFPAMEEAACFLRMCAQRGFLGGLTKTCCCFLTSSLLCLPLLAAGLSSPDSKAVESKKTPKTKHGESSVRLYSVFLI